MHRIIVSSLFVVALAACNSRGRGPDMAADPRCPDRVSTGTPCGSTEADLSCTGVVSCACGERSTTCQCGESGGVYGFSCVDSCSSCTTGDTGVGGARCGALYDHIQSSACPYPSDLFSREEYVGQCAMLAVSDACRAELESLISCALSSPVVCEDVGDGNRFPTFPSCGELSEMCQMF